MTYNLTHNATSSWWPVSFGMCLECDLDSVPASCHASIQVTASFGIRRICVSAVPPTHPVLHSYMGPVTLVMQWCVLQARDVSLLHGAQHHHGCHAAQVGHGHDACRTVRNHRGAASAFPRHDSGARPVSFGMRLTWVCDLDTVPAGAPCKHPSHSVLWACA